MRTRLATIMLLLALPISIMSILARPEPAAAAGKDEVVLERFPIAKNAYSLIAPVEIEGKRYPFIVDTGATYTIYDVSMRHLLGEPLRSVRTKTPNGSTTVLFFQSPDAKISKLPLPKGVPVALADLERLRQAADQEIYGLVGMDFLAKYVLRLDFDRGEIAFLRSVGPNPGERLPLTFRHGLPLVPVQIAGQEDPEPFVLDTGLSGLDSGDMGAELFDELVGKKKMSSLAQIRAMDLSGVVGQQQGRIESISLANHRHAHLLFSRSSKNLLGLRFCSRYVMTFDFPNRSLYVKKGRRFDSPDLQNLSGLHILRVKGEARVDTVDKGSPAEAAGIQPREVLLTLNGDKVSDIPLSVLREQFCQPDKQIRLLVRRGRSEKRELSFNLPKAK